MLGAAAGLTLALGMIFPVQYELDTAGYRATAARTSAPSLASADDVDGMREALGGAPTVVYIDYFSTVVTSGDRSLGNVTVWGLLGQSIDHDVTLMPDAARVAGAARDPDDHTDWIDISADIAAALNVGPGDPVEVEVGGDEPAAFTVRGVYATRHTGASGLAHVDGAAIARHDASIDMTSNSLASAAAPEAVERMLNAPPWSERMSALYSAPIEVEEVRDMLRNAEEHAFANFGLVLAVSAIALASLLAIIVGESIGVVSAFRSRAEILLELGARPSAVYTGLTLGVTVVTSLSVLAGSALGSLAYSTGFVGPALPPTVALTWGLATLLGIAAGTATTFIAAHLQRRELTLLTRARQRKATA